ncbi:MAG: DHHA1 domain-containing protein [Desulfobulbaceae bacterium]|nr:DHHA1 domain-containing protein [Desulfobulbaceae bacterium]
MKSHQRFEKIADCITRSESKNSALMRLNGFLELFDKDDEVLVVISADPDALASAMAVKRLLRYRVRNVTIGNPHEIRRLNNLEMLKRLRLPVERLQNLKVSDFDKKILLDSQPLHHRTFEKIQFDAVIDHHPVTDAWDAKFIDIRPNYGSLSSIMVEYLRAAGIKPSAALATALFYGIKVDTHNFEKSSLLADGISFRYLFNMANRNLVRKFELTDMRQSELKYFKTALNELKLRKGKAYVHVGRVWTPDVLVIIADFLNHVDQFDWVVVSGIHGERLVVIFRCDGYRKNAGKFAAQIFGKLGMAGGHKEAARAEVPLKNFEFPDNQEFTTQSLINLATVHDR